MGLVAVSAVVRRSRYKGGLEPIRYHAICGGVDVAVYRKIWGYEMLVFAGRQCGR